MDGISGIDIYLDESPEYKGKMFVVLSSVSNYKKAVSMCQLQTNIW